MVDRPLAGGNERVVAVCVEVGFALITNVVELSTETTVAPVGMPVPVTEAPGTIAAVDAVNTLGEVKVNVAEAPVAVALALNVKELVPTVATVVPVGIPVPETTIPTRIWAKVAGLVVEAVVTLVEPLVVPQVKAGFVAQTRLNELALLPVATVTGGLNGKIREFVPPGALITMSPPVT